MRGSRFRSVALVGALAALAVAGAGSPGLRSALADSVTRRPAQFTELYFDDHTRLPKAFTVGVESNFSFVVANHEGHQVDYAFVVTADSPLGTVTIEEGSLSMSDRQRAVEEIRFSPDRPGMPHLLTVRLLGRAEAIHFMGQS